MALDKFPQALRSPGDKPGESTGWAYTDAVKLRDCPKCGCHAGFYCQSPKGKSVWPPHSARVVVGPEHSAPAGSARIASSVTGY